MLLAVLEAAYQGIDGGGLIAARFVVDSQTKRGHLCAYQYKRREKWACRSQHAFEVGSGFVRNVAFPCSSAARSL